MDRKIPVTLHLRIEQIDRLDDLADDHGSSRAELVRKAVDNYLDDDFSAF